MTQSSSSSSLEDNIFELLQEAQQLATQPEQAVEAATKVCVDVILLLLLWENENNRIRSIE